nr:putative reverse transcriptase domain, viral movement protein [Tanacetum cinerariifolium]
MLSEKNMEVEVTTIQFLGMEIFDGRYQTQPHVAQELLKFPNELSSQKMIQQFLGLVNYMADFLPKLSHHTAWLFPMLKKNPPQWTSRQTEEMKAIKSLAEKMPPLMIPASSEKRILQTDASDECWGSVLLVQDNNNKRHVCGYKSGTFKAFEKHYHSTFKEILAVKRGIEKFQFHLIGHEFQVEMDMTSFPHFLSRPKAYKLEENYTKDASRVQNHTPYILSMVFSVASQKEEGSSSNTTPTIHVFDLPEEIVEIIGDLTFEKRAKLCYKTFLTILLKNHGLCIKGLRFHPDYPFLNIFHIHDLWRKTLIICRQEPVQGCPPPHSKHLLTMLQWFVPYYQWTRWLTITRKGTYVLVMFRRPGSFLPPKAVNDDGSVVYMPHIALFMTGTRLTHPAEGVKENSKLFLQTQEKSDDDDDARSLWSSDDDEHFDPFEDDPTHPDARWSP